MAFLELSIYVCILLQPPVLGCILLLGLRLRLVDASV